MDELKKLEEIYSMGFVHEEEYKKRKERIFSDHPELQGITVSLDEGTKDFENEENMNSNNVHLTTTSKFSYNDYSSQNIPPVIISSYSEYPLEEPATLEDVETFLNALNNLPISALNPQGLRHVDPPIERKICEWIPKAGFDVKRRWKHGNIENPIRKPRNDGDSFIEYFGNSCRNSDVIEDFNLLVLLDDELELKNGNELITECGDSIQLAINLDAISDHEELCLNNYRYLTEIPETLFSYPWSQLYHLEMRNCDLRSIPNQISNLTALVSLDLSFNSISNVGYEISNCLQLRTLDLSFNQISSIHDSVMSMKLEQLNLFGNTEDLFSSINHANFVRGYYSRYHLYPELRSPVNEDPLIQNNGTYSSYTPKYIPTNYYDSCLPTLKFPNITKSKRIKERQEQLLESMKHSNFFASKPTSSSDAFEYFNPTPFTYLLQICVSTKNY